MDALPEFINGRPNISGAKSTIENAVLARDQQVFLPESRLDFGRILAGATIACTCISR